MPTDRLLAQDAPSLINGVSKQPAGQRLSSQCQEQLNMVSDVAAGVARRPPLEHIKRLTGTAAGAAPSGGYYTHLINRGDGQQFVALIEDSNVSVYNLTTGAEVTVTDSADGGVGTWSYLNITPSASVTAENSFEAITVADYTFIVNKRITVAMGSASAARPKAHEFILDIRTGLASYHVQKLTIGATTFTPAGTANQSCDDAIDRVCTVLGIGGTPNDTTGVTAGSTNWKFTRYGQNLLHGYQFQNALENVEYSCGIGDATTNYLFLATSTTGTTPQTPSFSDLPRNAPDGFVVKVSGSEGSDEDEYYLTYDAASNIWRETVLAGLSNAFDAKTMPHALIYNSGTGQFAFTELTWDARGVGDTLSAPQPSFVGTQIRGITLHKNRLIVAADENLIATEAGDLFNFWPTTVTTLVESDPFDIAGTSNRVSIWEHMVNFEGNISVFSTIGDTMGELVGATDAPLTIKNARIEERAVYAFSDVKPVVLGTGIYFALDRGGYSSVYRYAKTDVFSFKADEITGHAQGYIPANVDHMKASAALQMLVLRSNDEVNALYNYRTHVVGNEQVMSSWSKWTFGPSDNILNFDFIETKLYVLTQRSDGLYLQVMDFGKLDEDEGSGSTPLGFRVYLDDLVELTGVYVSGLTTWTLPYDKASDCTYIIVKSGDWGTNRGQIITQEAGTTTTVTARVDHSAHSCYIGRIYSSEWVPSEAVPKTDQGSALSLSGSRLQLYRGRVQYLNTAAFDAVISSEDDSDEYLIPYRTNVINQSALDAVDLDTGIFDFPIGGNSKTTTVTLKSVSYAPCAYTAYEWEGRYVQRSDSI